MPLRRHEALNGSSDQGQLAGDSAMFPLPTGCANWPLGVNRSDHMQGIKQIIHTDRSGGIIDPPSLPANARLEASFRVVGSEGLRKQDRRRRPSPRIAGKGSILGDLIRSVAEAEEWDSNL
jgi:hypothetical protein